MTSNSGSEVVGDAGSAMRSSVKDSGSESEKAIIISSFCDSSSERSLDDRAD